MYEQPEVAAEFCFSASTPAREVKGVQRAVEVGWEDCSLDRQRQLFSPDFCERVIRHNLLIDEKTDAPPQLGWRPVAETLFVDKLSHIFSPDFRDALQYLLPLFSVLQFQNQECVSSTGNIGTCLTVSECEQRGGIINGTCAGGYGVCCEFYATCGQTVRENNTYFISANYPQPYDGTGACRLLVNKLRSDVCQYRLDFDEFRIAGPEPVNNTCIYDQFLVTGGSPINEICGINKGNHMYVDANEGQISPIALTFVTSGPTFSRRWKVRVSQIACSSPLRAESGCLQYFTGVTGQVKSFNYDPEVGLQLSNQDYSMCIRPERNFCGIQYAACPDTVNNRTHAFTLTDNTLSPTANIPARVASAGPYACTTDWLNIPCAVNAGRRYPAQCVDRICGGTFSAEVGQQTAFVYSRTRPFRLAFHTDSSEAPNDIGNRGFCLNYIQQPCSALNG
ncbi:uncharacterized protein LOC124613816 [Schistocerca americana]|uniref:uncharacterized protein LOC124613816 n=1 Tax=Schistocerca americana TaxID=7009 RepID=UPI001F503F77|nr:uncharacterized protein LOC124613816 [Schistocerca americana]